MKIILASESPFRRRALDMIGVAYEICPSRIAERQSATKTQRA
jgi:predicted house-cleaning NTP pyrophosphatase (Maf/HAM1 superfamily)